MGSSLSSWGALTYADSQMGLEEEPAARCVWKGTVVEKVTGSQWELVGGREAG